MFELDLATGRLDLIQELHFHGCCVLRVKAVTHSNGSVLLMSTGTKGRLAVWDVTSLPDDKELVPFGDVSVHQSGINCLDCRWTAPDELLVLTGGDDNALVCTKIRVNCKMKLVERLDAAKVLPHAAQISGSQ